MIKLTINVDDPDDLLSGYGAGALIRVERDSSSAFGSATEITTIAIVPSTTEYEYWDTTGTSSHYYRTRYSKASPSVATDYSAYSDTFQVGTPSSYASLEDVKKTLAVDGTTHDELLVDLIGDVSRDIDAACQRTFRVPSADVTVYVDIVDCGDKLSEASRGYTTDGRRLDFVSITSLWVRDSELDSYVQLTQDTDWYLQPGPPGAGVAGSEWAWEDIELSAYSDVTVFPRGKRAVKIIGKPGFPVVPPSVKRATISEVRERFRQSVGGGQMPAGVNQFGQPIFITGDSPDMRRIMRRPFSLREWVA
jgi:hypothetical protein